MTLNLPAPRRKPRVKELPGAALPLPSALPHLPFSHYQATYSQGHIFISDQRQAEALWHNGYFGHGSVASRNGKQKLKKRWKLVEGCGLKDGKWFKEQNRMDCVMDEDMSEEEEEIDKQDKEEKDTENIGTGAWEDEKEEESARKDEIALKGRLRKAREEEGIDRQDKEEKDTENMRTGAWEDEKVEEERGRKDEIALKGRLKKEEEEHANQTTHHEEKNIKKNRNSEPWETVLVLPKDQTFTTDKQPYLSLLPEEALFLSYALGCLVLTYSHPPASTEQRKRALVEQRTHEMTIDEMWRVFTSEDPAFAMKYAAYHHFRTQGWVVKDGLKYGVDYVLYPVGPPFYHSQYAVKVHSVWSDTLMLSQSVPGHEIDWTTLATMERLANHVNKTPVLCFVLRPRSLTQSRLDLIESLAELKVQEVVLGRWNPSDGNG